MQNIYFNLKFPLQIFQYFFYILPNIEFRCQHFVLWDHSNNFRHANGEGGRQSCAWTFMDFESLILMLLREEG